MSLKQAAYAAVILISLCYAQQIFINQVSDYYSLDSCAEPPLSTVVRDMYSGCGDGGKTTSYACFCSSSSSQFASIISTAVLKVCPGSTDDATSATLVFSEYCQLGASILSSTSSSTSTSTSNLALPSSLPLPASSPSQPISSSVQSTLLATTTVFSTPSPTIVSVSSATTSAVSTTMSISPGVIAAAVLIPIVVIAFLVTGGILFYRRRKTRNTQRSHLSPDTSTSKAHFENDDKAAFVTVGELPGQNEYQVLELSANRKSGQSFKQRFGWGGPGPVELGAGVKRYSTAELE